MINEPTDDLNDIFPFTPQPESTFAEIQQNLKKLEQEHNAGKDGFYKRGRPRQVVVEERRALAIKAETDEELQTQSRLMRLSLSFTDEQLTLLNQLALATPEQYGVIARSTNYAASHKRARFLKLIDRADAQEYIRLIRNSYISVPTIVDKAQKLYDAALKACDFKAANDALKLLATYKGMLVDRKFVSENKTITETNTFNPNKLAAVSSSDVERVRMENNQLSSALAAVIGAKVVHNPNESVPTIIPNKPNQPVIN